MKKLYLLFLLCSIKLTSFAQTIVINPTGVGGFETGTTFATNGWTVVNAAANQWAVGTGSISSGTNGAYIGNATTFVGVNSISVSHFYRDITIPSGATNVQLTFQYKQPVVDNGYDSFYVSTTSTTNTPAANVPLGAGYTRLYNNTGTVYATYNAIGPISLTSMAGTTFRLVFTYRNDGSNPIGVPAIDNISLTYCDLNIAGTASICPGNTTTLTNTASGVTWSSGTTSVATVGATTGIVAGVSAGTASITYTSGVCSASKIVTVNSPVTPSVSLTTALSGAVCAGSMATFNATPVNGGTSPFYQWSVNGIPVGGSGSVYSYIPSDGDVINVILNAAGGLCPAPTTATTSFTATITTYQTPAVTTAATPGLHVCAGAPVHFTATPTFGGAAPNYKWSRNGVYVATGPSYYGALTNGDVIKVLLFSNFPCRLADSVYSAESIMNVEVPTPAPTVSIVSSTGFMITAGETDSFVAVAAGGSGSPLYQWFVNSVPVAGATNAVFTTNTLTNGNLVSCKVSNNDFCGASTIKSVVVAVGALSVANVTNNLDVVSIAPNPNNGDFTISGISEDIAATITDMVGRIVYTEAVKYTDVKHNVRLGNIPAGVYMLSLKSATGNKVLRFVVD